jgi:hypothetical protein
MAYEKTTSYYIIRTRTNIDITSASAQKKNVVKFNL